MKVRPSSFILWCQTATKQWRVVPFEFFTDVVSTIRELMPTNDAVVQDLTAVSTETRTAECNPTARTAMVTNIGSGRVEIFVNGLSWGPLERSNNEANGRVIVTGHVISSIGVRKTSGPDSIIKIVFLRRI